MNSELASLLAFAATTLVIELTPGPNMGYLAILSAREGRRAGFAATFGIALGLLLVGLAAALGLTAVVATSRWLYETLRWAGVLTCCGSLGRDGRAKRGSPILTGLDGLQITPASSFAD